MAKSIQAFTEYGPQVIVSDVVQNKAVAEFIEGRTGLNRTELRHALEELANAVIYFNKQGMGVHIENLGFFNPGVELDGDFKVNARLEKYLRDEMNKTGEFTGEIANRENIGKSMQELIEFWDRDHPEDLIER